MASAEPSARPLLSLKCCCRRIGFCICSVFQLLRCPFLVIDCGVGLTGGDCNTQLSALLLLGPSDPIKPVSLPCPCIPCDVSGSAANGLGGGELVHICRQFVHTRYLFYFYNHFNRCLRSLDCRWRLVSCLFSAAGGRAVDAETVHVATA